MRQPALAIFYRHGPAAWLVLSAGMLLSVVAALLVAAQLEREAQLRFESALGDARSAIETRVNDYADVLRGVRGLFAASESVSRAEFARYLQNLNLASRFPGIQVIHYSRRFTDAERPAFEAMLRGDTSLEPRGYPDFAIRPAGVRPEYVVAMYVEPMAGNERALGLDLGGDPVRLAALNRTRDSGLITASGAIALALDPARHPGFAMRLAIYREGAPLATVAQRRAAFTGMVSASFVAIDLMRGVLPEPFLQRVHVRIHDGGFVGEPGGLVAPAADNLMFDSDRLLGREPAPQQRWEAEAPRLRGISNLEIGGRKWSLHFHAREGFADPIDRWMPWSVLAGGAVISLLLFGLVRSLAMTGRRAVALADRITVDLRRSEASLAEAQRVTQQLIEALPNPVFFKGTDGRYLGVNKAWETFFGTPRTAFVGKTVHDLYPGDPGVAARLQEKDRALWDSPVTSQVHEESITTPDGARHEVIYYKATFTRGDGSVAGLIGTIVDITERKRAEGALRESEARYRSVIAAIAEGVVLRDRDHRILTCNASAERILGRSFEQMRGRVSFDPAWEPIRTDCSPFPEAERPVSVAMRTGQLQSNVEMGFRKPDRSVLWLSVSAQPLFDDPNGAPSGCVTTFSDITARKLAEQRQAMEHAVTQVLASAESVAEAAPRILQTICESLGWACGAHWQWDKDAQVLRAAHTWHAGAADIAEFVTATGASMNEAPAWRGGAPKTVTGGLVRRVWMDGAPVWFPDVSQAAGFRRGAAAAKAGLHCAFGFPVMAGTQPLGVMEFYSRQIGQPDHALLQVVQAIGSQVGQFVVRKQAEERERYLANFDELTGLPNRTQFNQRLGHALARARRAEEPLAVLFIDLDRFKNVNDTLGHTAGDRALMEIAQRLRGCLREVDTVSRLGGDEFVVLIEGAGQPADTAEVAQKILTAVARPVILEEQEFHLTASIGISTCPGDSGDLQGLMKNADIAMYRAKEQGKNTFQFYSAQINTHTLARVALEADLRHALERKEFLLHFQPKVDIPGNRIVGVEALVRWQQPGKALVPPALFIPLAEETGLIVSIGEWVLRTACLQNKAWQAAGLPRMRIAVNLSPRQFTHEHLLEDVARMLAQTGLDAADLELEITESMVMRDPERAITLLGGLKAMGVHLSMDDFGTGYSSLSYLKRFPLDSVKIDRSFIHDLPDDSDDVAITQAIIAMAHSLRLGVIAEGVETEEQLRFLRDHGCDQMQGYLFSKPLPEAEITRLLRRAAPAGVEVAAQD
jgi:diguanylate cyclase (GGDEF)-like protein/PAS domain S-box-containing protein